MSRKENNLGKVNSKPKLKKLFEKDGTFITIKNKSLLVLDSETLDKSAKALKICSGFYIEMGRSISDFNNALKNTKLPIFFQYVISIKGYKHYNVIRMNTENADEMILCTLVCKDDIIEKIAFSRDNIDKSNYEEYERLGTIWIAGRFEYNSDKDINKNNAKINVLAILGKVLNLGNDISLRNLAFGMYGDKAKTIAHPGATLLSSIKNLDTDADSIMYDNYTDNELKDFIDKVTVNGVVVPPDNIDMNGILMNTSYNTVSITTDIKTEKVKYKFKYVLNEVNREYELVMISLL